VIKDFSPEFGVDLADFCHDLIFLNGIKENPVNLILF